MVILTGDNHITADAIAREVGVESVVVDVLTVDKIYVIWGMQNDPQRTGGIVTR